MRIREYTSDDFDALRRLHAAQGFGYALPNLDSPLFVTKLVLEDNGGREALDRESLPAGSLEHEAGARVNSRIVMAVLLRLTAETYFLHDPSAGTPRERWQRLIALHEAARQDAAARGLDDVQAFVPPQIARAFGRRLAQLGWARDPWPCFSRRVP